MTYPFDRYFRLKILSLLLDPRWVSIYGDTIIASEYFEEDDEIAISDALLEYNRNYAHPPGDPTDLLIMLDMEHEDTVGEIYELYQDADFEPEFTSDMVVQFAREQAAKNAVLEGVDDIKRGDLSKLLERIQEAVNVGQSIMAPGINFLDVDSWLYELWSDKVMTGFPFVDAILEGGLGPGELGVILAPVNRGKSMALVNIGYGAASIGSGKNVIHFTHEMSTGVVAKRYAARMVFKFPKRTDNLKEYKEELLYAAKRLMPGNIRIVGGPERMTVSELRHHVKRLIAEGFDPGLIVDDYADLLVSTRRYKERRFELSDIYTELRALGAEFGVPVWTASQARRTALDREIITLQDIAEDIGKANVSDVIIALCQTHDEYDLERCRLFMAKVRDGKRSAMFDAKYYEAQQAIIPIKATERRDEKDV